MFKRYAAIVAVLALLPSAMALSAEPAPRAFAPVQDGFVDAAETVLPWAPDRVLVKFTPEGLRRSSLAGAKADPGATFTATSLPSLDTAIAQLGVTGIRAAQYATTDKSRADRPGTELWYRFDLSDGADVPEVARQLARDPNLEYALPDLRAFPAVTPNDPFYADNWGHENTAQLPDLDWGGTYAHTLATTVGTVGFDANADVAWNGSQGYGSAGVVIAILDSGVDTAHPDLNLVAGYDFGDNDNDPMDDSAVPGHGTACAGVAAASANNGLGVVGVAGGCSIMPVKIADSTGAMYFSYIVDAVYYAANNGADVISMSIGAAATAYAPMDDAVSYAVGLGVTVLAATGNENDSTISYPAYNPDVIGVGAASPCGERKRSSSNSGEVNSGVFTDPNGYTCDGERWWGSNYGSTTQDHQGAVDIIAPTILPTTDITGGGGYSSGDYDGFFNGTSCATPYAAGVCGLIISANPSFTPAQVRAQLVGTAQDVTSVESGAGWDRYTGYGMVDAAAAVGGGTPPAPVAAFTQSPTSGCAPLTVDFTDQSTGTIDTWAWTFGDGGSSTLANPSHIYAAAGLYSVSLTVTGPGGSDLLTMTDLISVDGLPTAAYSATPTTIGVGDAVAFTDASTEATSWNWDFGDGGTSTVQNPVYNYALPGLFTVRLIAGNTCGTDTMTVADQITVVAQQIVATIDPVQPLSGPVSVYALPDGAGDPLTAARSWSGTPDDPQLIVDATIGIRLVDGFGAPVVGFPAAQIFVQAQAGGWVSCVGSSLTADAPTDANGETTISGTLTAAGHSGPGELMEVVVDSPLLASTNYPAGLAGLEYFVNSSDVNGDLATNLVDVPLFASLFFASTYDYAGDFLWDGDIDLSDVTMLAAGMGRVCAPAAAKAVAEATVPAASGTEIGISFDLNGYDASGMLETGQQIDAYVVLRGTAAERGVDAFDVRIRTSGNIVVHEQNVVGRGLDVSDGDGGSMVGYAETRNAADDGSLPLLHLRVSVTDDQPARFWLEPSAGSDLKLPAVVREGERLTARPVSGDVARPVASLNDKDFELDGEVPAGRSLALNIAPNPFNPSTEIRFNLPAASHVELRVFDARGKLVATLFDAVSAAGENIVVWNGTDRSGRATASGVYFAVLRTDMGVRMDKMLLVK